MSLLHDRFRCGIDLPFFRSTATVYGQPHALSVAKQEPLAVLEMPAPMTVPRGGRNFPARPTARHAKGCRPVHRILADHPPSWPLAPSDRCRVSTAIGADAAEGRHWERRYRLLV